MAAGAAEAGDFRFSWRRGLPLFLALALVLAAAGPSFSALEGGSPGGPVVADLSPFAAAAAAGRLETGRSGAEWTALRDAREADWAALDLLLAELAAERAAREKAASEGQSSERKDPTVVGDLTGLSPSEVLAARHEAAFQRVLRDPEGVPMARPDSGGLEDWFDWRQGMTLYRSQPGDATEPGVRQRIAASRYFYYDGYPEGIRNFADGSMQRDLAEELARAAVAVLPALTRYEDGISRALRPRLGWALVETGDGRLAAEVWSRFQLAEGWQQREGYVVGGIMEFRLLRTPGAARGQPGDRYLDPVGWRGPVAVERHY